MTKRELEKLLVESGLSNYDASLLAEECFDQMPPRALIPPEIMSLNCDLGVDDCITYSDILECYFDSERIETSYQNHEFESGSRLIGCPMCGEHIRVETNTDAGLFILAHQALHRFELNFSAIESWDSDDFRSVDY